MIGLVPTPFRQVSAASNRPDPSQVQDPRNHLTDNDPRQYLRPPGNEYLSWMAAGHHPDMAYPPSYHQQQYFGNYQQMSPDEHQYHRSGPSPAQTIPDDHYLVPLPTDFNIGRTASEDLKDVFFGIDLAATNSNLAVPCKLRSYLAFSLPLLPPRRRHRLPPTSPR